MRPTGHQIHYGWDREPQDDEEDVELNPRIPEVNLNIQVQSVQAEPRRLGRPISAVDRLAAIGEGKEDPGDWQGLSWSLEAAEDLRSLLDE